MFPFGHLSNKLASSEEATSFLSLIEEELADFEVTRVHFGSPNPYFWIFMDTKAILDLENFNKPNNVTVCTSNTETRPNVPNDSLVRAGVS